MPLTPLRWLATSLLVLCVATPASAGEKEECVHQHVAGQRLRRAGSLRAARAEFLACARDACPPVIQEECSQWLAEVEASQPTVVFVARDASGNEIADVTVEMDGAPFVDRLTGVAIGADPGDHVFRVVASDGRAIDQRVVLHEGEKRREIVVDFGAGPAVGRGQGHAAPKQPEAPAPARAAWPPSVYVLGGIGALGLAGFASFGVIARSNADDLESCRPTCDRSAADAMRTQAAVADVSLAIAVVSLGVAALLVAMR